MSLPWPRRSRMPSTRRRGGRCSKRDATAERRKSSTAITSLTPEENLVEESCLKIAGPAPGPWPAEPAAAIAAVIKNQTTETGKRMGRFWPREIAERAVSLVNPPHIPIPEKLQRMAEPDHVDGAPEPGRLRQPSTPAQGPPGVPAG